VSRRRISTDGSGVTAGKVRCVYLTEESFPEIMVLPLLFWLSGMYNSGDVIFQWRRTFLINWVGGNLLMLNPKRHDLPPQLECYFCSASMFE
jgi:hypothetical protein